jgi:hypothetical protein
VTAWAPPTARGSSTPRRRPPPGRPRRPRWPGLRRRPRPDRWRTAG